MTGLTPHLNDLLAGRVADEGDTYAAFQVIMRGEATPEAVAAYLTAVRMRGETVGALVGAVRALKEVAKPAFAPPGAIDTAGTGGDGAGTLNISTGAAILIAATGVPVAKHGNRAMSSKSGSADVLEALGIKLDLDADGIKRCFEAANIAFFLAPNYHPAMRHVSPVRKAMGIRTIANLLGPLVNPAAAPFQLVGVYAKEWIEPMAHTLASIGCQAAWVVHGADGLDELALSGPTAVAELREGVVTRFEVVPEDAGFEREPLDAIKGGDAETNAEAIRALVAGKANAYRNICVLNAAAALVVAGRADHLAAAARTIEAAIDSGQAAKTLASWAAASHVREKGQSSHA